MCPYGSILSLPTICTAPSGHSPFKNFSTEDRKYRAAQRMADALNQEF